MAIIKWQKDNNLSPNFNSIFNDWFTNDYFDKVAVGTSVPAVNVKDGKDSISVSIAAPGLKKEDFKISLDNHILTISAEQKSEKEEEEDGKYTRKEYNYSSFSRSFTVPESINKSDIEATYENGELKISLPKREEVKAISKEISVK